MSGSIRPGSGTNSGIVERLKNCRLYGIVDLGFVAPNEAPLMLRKMLDGGVDLVQLRAKSKSSDAVRALAEELHVITSAAAVPLVINDYPEVARDIGAEGVHVGQDDESVAEARGLTDGNCVVGKSTHSLDQARAAVREGADYIGFGPLFATPTKPDYVPMGLQDIGAVHTELALPIFCIGGIKLENLEDVIAAGARRVVIVSGLLQAGDVAKYARACKAMMS